MIDAIWMWGFATFMTAHQPKSHNPETTAKLTEIEYPRKAERVYLASLEIAAVYVGTYAGEHMAIIGASRDLARSAALQQEAWPTFQIVAAWWVQDRQIAEAIVKAVEPELRFVDPGPHVSDAEHAVALIEDEARKQHVKLTDHATALKRVKAGAAQIKATVEAFNRAGELKWFNAAYRDYRAAGGRLTYAASKARLHRALVKRVVLGDRVDLGASIIPEIFGETGRTRSER